MLGHWKGFVISQRTTEEWTSRSEEEGVRIEEEGGREWMGGEGKED